MKKVTWFKTATLRLEERLAQFFLGGTAVGPVMVTVGTVVGRGFVGVDDEPWLCLGVDPRAGRLLAVEDLIGKIKNHYNRHPFGFLSVSNHNMLIIYN